MDGRSLWGTHGFLHGHRDVHGQLHALRIGALFFFFVAVRFMQGIGGAMMVPVGRIVIWGRGEEQLVTALNYLTIPALLGPVFGPPWGDSLRLT